MNLISIFSSTSLQFSDQHKYDRIIISSEENPFPEPPARSQLVYNPPKFMIGRQAELEKLISIYSDVCKSGEPKLAFIQGSQGVGKSTLAATFVKEKEKEYSKIILIPFETSTSQGGFTFKKFYGECVQTLIQSKNLYWLGYHVAVKVLELYQNHLNDEFNVILETLHLTSSEYLQLKNDSMLIEKFTKPNKQFLKAFTSIFHDNFNYIYNYLPILDPELFLVIWYCIFPSAQAIPAMRALRGNGEFNGFEVQDDVRAKSIFKSLVELIKWIDDKSIITIAIDHLEAGVANPTVVYNELFSLLVQLRQQNHVFIILSGTFDAFSSIEKTVQDDMNNQIQNWAMKNSIALSSLPEENVRQIITQHLTTFWMQYNMSPPSNNSLYPYSDKSVDYLYNHNQRDLRKTLEKLFYDFKEMGVKNKVTSIVTLFDAFKKFREISNYNLNVNEIRILNEKILDPKIQDKRRSSMLENAIYNVLARLANQDTRIANVKHEPQLGRRKLKPDVYFETGTELHSTKRVAIEIKLYRKGKYIPKKEVQKTHSLLEDGLVDFIIWITNKPLSDEKFLLPINLQGRVGRIDELTLQELGYASLILYHDELYGKELEDPEWIVILLQKAGLDLELILNRLSSLDRTDGKLVSIKVEPEIVDYFPDPYPGDPFDTNEITIETEEIFNDLSETDTLEDLSDNSTEDIDKSTTVEYEVKIVKEIQRNSHKSWTTVSKIMKDLSKNGLDLLQIYNKDDAANYILTVAQKNGYATTATRIKFK